MVIDPTPSRRIAWVTGANRGIGQACAVALAGRGFDIVGTDLGGEAGAEDTARLVAEAGARFTFVGGDIANIKQHGTLVEAATQAGPLACLVNNAGVQTRGRVDLLDLSPAEFDRVLGVNLRGTFFLSQAVAKAMLAAPASKGRTIITITSAAAVAANPNVGAYCMSKAGLSMMVRLLAIRLAEKGIAVHEIRPGLIRTDMTGPNLRPYEDMLTSGRVPLRRWGMPEDIGRAVSALAAGELPYTTGDVFNISGGLQIDQIL